MENTEPREKELTLQKILNIFGSSVTRTAVIKAEADGALPKAKRAGKSDRRVWSYHDLPAFGERFGFLNKPSTPKVVTFFATKGGIFKSTLALNFARMTALHGIKTIVVGLDMQCDITGDLGYGADITEDDTLDGALQKLSKIYGLEDFNAKRLSLQDIIEDSDIPTLKFIPETPALTQLDRDIAGMDFREHWLKTNITEPLKKDFDIIVLDCSPNWNNLITNALIASDLIVSPLECKIKHFRNFPYFKTHIESFLKKTNSKARHYYVATKFTKTKILSRDIKKWYQKNVTNCFGTSIRESAKAEEACAALLSVPEFVPTDVIADEMREFISEVWEQLVTDLDVEKTPSVKKSKMQTVNQQTLG